MCSSENTDGFSGEITSGIEDSTTLSDAVKSALDKTGHTCLRQIVLSSVDGHVRLQGVVPSFYLKQLALSIVMAVPGVAGVRNELVVEAR